MVKFHVNPQTFKTGRCRAKKKCPFGGEEVHFENEKKAQSFAEEILAEEVEKLQTRDFQVNEKILLGEYYDTPNTEAVVLSVNDEEIRVKSYKDGEEYLIDKAIAKKIDSQLYLTRKLSNGEYFKPTF